MKLPFVSEKKTFYGKLIPRTKEEQSSLAGNVRRGGISGNTFDRIYPRIEFWKRMEYYLTVGRVQNVVESFVLNIQNREHYYDSKEEGEIEEKDIELMEAWEEQVRLNRFFGNTVRNWIINGIHIVSPVDWVPLQLQSIIAKRRDLEGNTIAYIQYINGIEHVLDAKDFLEIPYIELDREPWPTGLFDSLMNRDYIDIDGGDPRASLELYRQALQDNMKIHHKYASPRVVYTIPNANRETIDNDIIPLIEGMRPGDRIVLNEEIKIEQETVDGNARFIEHVNKIIDEIDTGLQSSQNRLITEPSAMADAKEAGQQDDDRILGIMERLRLMMNFEVIPRITGRPQGDIIFKWGAKDAFDLSFPDALEKALAANVIAPEKAALILENNYHWKIPTDEEVMDRFGTKPEEPQDTEPKEPNIPPEEIPNEMKMKTEALNQESIRLSNKLKNEKIVFTSELSRKLKET